MSVFRPGLFKGKVALVTGGGSGIGKAIATELNSLGCKVVIASRNLEKLEKAAGEISQHGEAVTPIQCNIRKPDEVESAVHKVLEQTNRIDFLVNNGGGQFLSRAEDMTIKGWNAVIETNLTGTFLMSQEVFKRYLKSNGGAIVNITCDMFRGFPMMAHTGAARAAVDNLTKSLSVEFAESGVRVNSVAPGVIFSKTAKDNYPVDVFEMAKPTIPAQRLGTPEEVSSAVCFLLSPGAAFINGATLRVDAGSSLYARLFTHISPHDKMPPYNWQEAANTNTTEK